MKRDGKRIVGLWILAAALIVLVFSTGVLDKQMTWVDLPYSLLRFEDGAFRNVSEGDAYGVMNDGPDLDLPAGEYRLKWRIEADGENHIEITSENGVQIPPIPLSSEAPSSEAFFTIKDAAQGVDIRVVFEEGTYIHVADMRLYSPVYTDHAITFALFVAGICLLYTLHACGCLTPGRRGRLILIGFAVLMASGPALKDTIGIGHDTTFHLVRLCNLADGLKGGLPVRIGGFTYNGYGAVTSVFYPDLFLYPFALMMCMGASMQYAANALMIAVNIASAAAMYAAAKRIFEDEWSGTCASILYTLSIYRISDVFTRFAVGEMIAMAFLPLFLLGLYEAVLGDKRRWKLLAISAACIFLSHMLSTLICAMTAIGFCALFIVRIVRERRMMALIKAALGALLLCAFQLVPLLMYSMQGLGAQELMKDPAYSVIHPAQLFLLGEGELSMDPRDPALATFAMEIGFPLLMAAALALYVAATAEKKDEKNGFAVLFALAGCAFALMSTTLFPWGHVRILTRGMSDYLQFPWRFLMMTAVLLALAGGYGCARFFRGHGEKMAAAALCVAVLCALPTLTDETRNADYIAFGEVVSPNLQYTEYTLPGTKTTLTMDQSVLTEGDVTVTAYEKESTTVSAQVNAAGEAKISLPLFGYDGYRATVEGKEMAISLGDNNRLTVHLPAGTQGEMRVWFAGKTAWRIAEAASLTAAVCMAVMCIRKKKTERRAKR